MRGQGSAMGFVAPSSACARPPDQVRDDFLFSRAMLTSKSDSEYLVRAAGEGRLGATIEDLLLA